MYASFFFFFLFFSFSQSCIKNRCVILVAVPGGESRVDSDYNGVPKSWKIRRMRSVSVSNAAIHFSFLLELENQLEVN